MLKIYMPQSALKWKFSTPKDHLLIMGGSLLSITVPVAALSLVLAPGVLGVVGAVSVGLIVLARRLGHDNAVVHGYTKLDEQAKESRLARKVAEFFALKVKPEIHVENSRAILVTFSSESNSPQIQEVSNESSDYSFFTELASGRILTNRRSLKNHSEDQVHFILGHEIAHLKTESNSLAHFAMQFNKVFAPVMGCSILALGALSVLGIASAPLSLSTFFAAVALNWTTKKVSDLSLKFSNRYSEYRADRNALYACGDLSAALNVMAGMHVASVENRPEFLCDHPSLEKRAVKLAKAWSKVAGCRKAAGLPVKKYIPAAPGRSM